MRPPEGKASAYVAVSAHMSNTTAKRSDVATELLSQLRKVAEENDVDILGFFISSAYRDRGREGRSFMAEAWSGTLLTLPARHGPNAEPKV